VCDDADQARGLRYRLGHAAATSWMASTPTQTGPGSR
jgi:hypothetical protein